MERRSIIINNNAATLKGQLGLPDWRDNCELSDYSDKTIDGKKFTAWEQYNLSKNIDSCLREGNEISNDILRLQEIAYSWIEYAFGKWGIVKVA